MLAQALRTGRGLGALAVIVHLGSHLGSGFDAGLERAVPVLERVLELAGDGTWLLLENTAGAGGTMGRTVAELAAIIDRCGAHPWLGVCLDSAHLYASGVDVGDVAAVDAMLDELDETIGLDRLKALHINDSQTALGSNRDRHANVGEGMIGERMSAFLGRPRLQDLPALLETPGHDGQGHRRAVHAARSSASGAWARQLTMRVAVVDPQAFTLPYDDELCRSLAAAGAEVELLTAHFTHGAPPRRRGLRPPRALRAAARRPDRPPADLAGAHPAQGGRARARPRAARPPRALAAPRHRALAVGAAARARPARAARRGARRRARRSSPRTTCCRAARATRRRSGPSCTRAATA